MALQCGTDEVRTLAHSAAEQSSLPCIHLIEAATIPDASGDSAYRMSADTDLGRSPKVAHSTTRFRRCCLWAMPFHLRQVRHR